MVFTGVNTSHILSTGTIIPATPVRSPCTMTCPASIVRKIAHKYPNVPRISGQCQRLVIARALLRTDSAVYIFDEAASNIDVESEELIMDVIHQLARTKTVLLISHRLANVVNSDQIYFLKDGEIKESGKHEVRCSRSI